AGVQRYQPPFVGLEAQDLDGDLILDAQAGGPRVLEDVDRSERLAEILSQHPSKALLERLSPELILVVDEAILPAASDDLRPGEVARKQHWADADGEHSASAALTSALFRRRSEHEGLRSVGLRREHRAPDHEAGEREDQDGPHHFVASFCSARPRSNMLGLRSSSSANRRKATAASDRSSRVRSMR